MRAISLLPNRQAPDALYDAKFFDSITEGALRSARLIAPLVIRLSNIQSVVDVGCGTGAWLAAFIENGVNDVLGIDGDYVDRNTLLIEQSQFYAIDLTRPRSIARCFDLAICLEVGEHLPTRVAPSLVEMLVKAAPLVLFSAAIPGQGGTHHINEQWPIYWDRLFSRHGYQRLDPFRRHVCFDRRIQWWYRQNLFLYASQERIANSEILRQEQEWASQNDMQLVSSLVLSRYLSFSGLLSQIPGAAWRAIKNRLTIRR
jgi:SAM-dependent methyltransferase